ncbi:MAG TPA: iron-containing alcohol dehydrogenase [Dehalococcoidales bacterium]|nr:iron-containing alcohol dehydrogenase [Dehalococcoidales bacterium]
MFIMNKVNIFRSPNKVIFGNGTVSQVGVEVEKMGARKALIVTDAGVAKGGLIAEVEKSLKASKIDYGLFDRVEAEPPARIVDECAREVTEKKYDVIVGVGGGSSMDVSKGASIVATNGGKVLDYVGNDIVPRAGVPKILLPTTAGTGSEVTRVFVVTDEADNDKKVVFSDYNLSSVAIIDPLLTLSMPPGVTADTGMDALVHAAETYVSRLATPFSDILALEAISLIGEYLPVAYAKAENVEARYNMSLAATLAGLAFSSGGLGAVHALAYVLGTEYHMSHGRTNAIMLPYVVDYNKTGALSKYARIAQAMGEKTAGLSDFQAAERLVLRLHRLLSEVGIPDKLGAYGISAKDLPVLVAGGMKNSRLFVPNPRDLTEGDVEKIYRSAL